MKRILSLLAAAALLFSLLAVYAVHAESGDFAESEVYVYLTSYLNEHTVPEENGRLYVDVSQFSLGYREIFNAAADVLQNEPQFFYLSNSMGIEGGLLYFTFRYTGAELDAKKERFASLTNRLFEMHDPAWSDFETALFYHDYLAAHYAYDETYTVSDAFGFFDGGVGVCNAYTLAYAYILRHFGIPCATASSVNINHIWNVAKIGGAWYHVDVTHDDPTGALPGAAMHDYFLTGAQTTYALKSDFAAKYGTNVDDVKFSRSVEISESDHPSYAALSDLQTPAEVLKGGFYAVKDAAVRRFQPESYSFELLRELPEIWRIAGGNSYYAGNFSSLVSDGAVLYFNDASAVWAYDPESGRTAQIAEYEREGTCVFGLALTENGVTARIAQTPVDNGVSETVFTFGDTDAGGAIDINDVSALLDALSTGGDPLFMRAYDVQTDGKLDINDVSRLLDLLAG